jgi:hypothetical protein
MVLSSVFQCISTPCSRVPHGTFQTRLLGSLLHGVLNFYPQKHYSVEPHSLGSHGWVYRLDTRFFEWLITFPL